MFNILYDLFSTILIKNNVDVVLFSNLPHEGPDLILYKIARKLNLETIMLYQTLFPNKFFYLFDIDDFGKFSECETNKRKIRLKNWKSIWKNLFYMPDTKKINYDLFHFRGVLEVYLLIQ